MTPENRLAAVLELFELIEQERRPADLLASTYFQARRYIGGSDRRAISERLWGMLRRRARLGWWLERRQRKVTWRGRLITDLVMNDRLTLAEIVPLFTGGERALAPLDKFERDYVQEIRTEQLTKPTMEPPIRGEYPAWLEPRLSALYGDRLDAEMAAARDPAPVDLRVNTLKTDLAGAQKALSAAGLEARPTPWSPLGLRLPARTPLTAQEAFRAGLVDVQDEGSQIIALMVGAKPGESVCDYCAGAGGKALALAAAMKNKGRLAALDTDQRRSDRSAERLKRAGVDNVQRRVIEGAADKWVKRQAGVYDRVLVDAPCSGSGTWRRNPDAKWRLEEKDLQELVPLQAGILASASRLVKPGGRLVYATCSLFFEEDEAQVVGFLARNTDFAPIEAGPLWKAITGAEWAGEGPWLRLSPARHNTDGFFVAVMERKG